MSTAVTVAGIGFLGVLLAGYVAQYYLPAPTPKIVGIDLGTTYSSIGVYHAGSGEVEVIDDSLGRKAFPSIVTFLQNGTILACYDAMKFAHDNPSTSFYDAKRFIGKSFSADELNAEATRYQFDVVLNGTKAFFVLRNSSSSDDRLISPQQIGAVIIRHLVDMAQRKLNVFINKAVISVPAEFNAEQRNATIEAARLAGVEVLRVINEPTAAALAYGLHKKERVEHVIIVDLGGGTLDVSILFIQGGMFITRAMAGNNHLGGQDFTQRLLTHILSVIKDQLGYSVSDAGDIQALRQAVEDAKLTLTYSHKASIAVDLHYPNATNSATDDGRLDLFRFDYPISRATFEKLNDDLFQRILKPIEAALEDVHLSRSDIDEVVLVGGSTRIPRIREIIAHYFGGKMPNFSIDPELAVVSGVAVQAGVIGGAWPLQVSATELPAKLRKIHVYDDK